MNQARETARLAIRAMLRGSFERQIAACNADNTNKLWREQDAYERGYQAALEQVRDMVLFAAENTKEAA